MALRALGFIAGTRVDSRGDPVHAHGFSVFFDREADRVCATLEAPDRSQFRVALPDPGVPHVRPAVFFGTGAYTYDVVRHVPRAVRQRTSDTRTRVHVMRDGDVVAELVFIRVY